MRPLALVLLVGLLSGCSLFGDDDNTEPPVKLEAFERRVELKKIWSRNTGSGTDKQFIKLVPTLVDGRVYVADRKGMVSVVELETGKLVWKKKTGIPISAGTGVGEGMVLVGSSEGELVALDAENGEIRWNVEVSSEVLSVPQVFEDVVIVQTVDGNLTGLNAENGDSIWIHDRSVPVLTLRGTSTPLVQDGVILAGFANGKMTALETSSGREIWEAAVAVPHGRTELQRIVDLDANPVVHQGILYVTSYQGRLMAISLQNGRVLWNRDMSAYAGIAVDNSQVYVSDTDSEVWALDRRSGGSLWKQGALRRRSLTGPVAIDGYVGVGDFEGYLHLLSRLDGSVAGRVRVDSDGIAATPVTVSGDRLLVLGAGGTLALYQLEPV
ncbi:Outer membrane beta-barrel assembly protein BamB [hydrothermal vent metagenome]|uniref:Outer membrane beta-barrel assembly protein BamB n=1 Tax=hydrothermal vent metagenome TaxID=652676 RepID=A0A3B0XWX3_9ZZZZ